jgi:lipopolysaccharide cholinephosphotransferase
LEILKKLPSFPARVVASLEDAGIPYWIDSGTLLGLYRDGKLIASDNDVDIGVYIRPEDEVQLLLETLGQLGHQLIKTRASGKVFRVKTKKIQKMKVDLALFRLEDEVLRCPSVRGRSFKHELANGSNYLQVAWPWLVRNLYLKASNRNVTSWPWKIALFLEQWEIPADLVLPITQEPVTGMRIPARIDEYLTYRYGEWRVPKDEWFYPRDDGAYRADPRCPD